MSYHRFKAEDGTEYGSFEVFYNADESPDFVLDPWDSDPQPAPVGWYWVAGFPGCLWDGDPQGPYESEREAIDAAQMEA